MRKRKEKGTQKVAYLEVLSSMPDLQMSDSQEIPKGQKLETFFPQPASQQNICCIIFYQDLMLQNLSLNMQSHHAS